MIQSSSHLFILYGIGGVYNYGCEAIVRGTVIILRETFPGCDIAYVSKRPAEDTTALADCPVRIIPHKTVRFPALRRAIKFILRCLRLPNQWIPAESLTAFPDNAVIISIGGDIFTLGKGPYPNLTRPEWLDTHFALARRKAPYVLWGASIGPFEQWPQIVPFMRAFLLRISLITVREPVTINYLKVLGITDNVAAVFDPAFLMPPAPFDAGITKSLTGEGLIAVNLSPLSVANIYGPDGYEDAILAQKNFLAKVMEETRANLLLIPHVICPGNTADDDAWYLRRIHEGMPAEIRSRVSFLEPGLGAMRTKSVLAQCDALIAARMHCAIAGVSCGTPTIFLSYSAKAAGMSELVYGHRNYCIQLEQLSNPDAVLVVKDLWHQRAKLRAMLTENKSNYESRALHAGNVLKKTLEQAV